MAYPEDYEDCTELNQIDALDVVDYDRIQDMITAAVISVCDCSVTSTTNIQDTLSVMESGIKQILGEIVEDVNETETYFKETGFKVII